jgi:ABC-type multidrug transport system ATPase subunit
MSVPYGDIFGLLGPNGAGKTTTLSILSGLISRSGGVSKVGGYDTESQLDNIHQVMGICPQHDLLFDELTVKDHFYFYCRLKGIKSKDIDATVNKAAEAVDLRGKLFLRQAKQLSGGGRRRLSIGISFLGDPSIVFLDEPSTGLDPTHRKEVW